MAVKIKSLTGNPADFHLPITARDLDGTEVEVIFTFKGRTLRDWHPVATKRMTDDANRMISASEEREDLEKQIQIAETDAEPAEGATKRKKKTKRIDFDESKANEAIDTNLRRSVEIIREVASGWDLDDDFTDENLESLCSRFPGIHQEVWGKYDSRVRGNRLGN